jgi:hypothetical protein
MGTIAQRDRRPPRWAVDALLDRYVLWREECESVRLAYTRWGRAEPSDGRLAYSAYVAALDREEHAARAYADQIRRMWPLCSG